MGSLPFVLRPPSAPRSPTRRPRTPLLPRRAQSSRRRARSSISMEPRISSSASTPTKPAPSGVPTPAVAQDLSDAQLDQLFASLPPNSLVRFWAFQGTIATNVATHQLDWGPTRSGVCRGCRSRPAAHRRPRWPGKRLRRGPLAGPGLVRRGIPTGSSTIPAPLTVEVSRRSPTGTISKPSSAGMPHPQRLGMWEPMSEAEASTCSQQYQPTSCSGHQSLSGRSSRGCFALRYFFDTVGGEIHCPRPAAISSRAASWVAGQCGTRVQRLSIRLGQPGYPTCSPTTTI